MPSFRCYAETNEAWPEIAKNEHRAAVAYADRLYRSTGKIVKRVNVAGGWFTVEPAVYFVNARREKAADSA